jgi:hypothetical protein
MFPRPSRPVHGAAAGIILPIQRAATGEEEDEIQIPKA